MRRYLFAGCFVVGLVSVGCTESHGSSQGGDDGGQGDGSISTVDGGGGLDGGTSRHCHLPGLVDDDTTLTSCAQNEWCDVGPSCGNSGLCVPRPDACTLEVALVCGCDDVTYSNACAAAASGVSVAHGGRCESAHCTRQEVHAVGSCERVLGVFWIGSVCQTLRGCSCVGEDCDHGFESGASCLAAHESCARSCGGLVPDSIVNYCLAGEFCHYDLEDICGAADAPGICTPRPQACTEEYQPVCGCNGVTYGNACAAFSNGTSIQSEGPCDCRAEGCPSGQQCSLCFAHWSCLPDGAQC